MSPLIIPIEDNRLADAKMLIEAGKLICFPTETVYALAADATNPQAVAAIYQAKGRNPQNPLSLLVADLAMAERVAFMNDQARALATHFWPGPLTLVLPAKKGQFASTLNQGAQTIGIRIPDHPFARALLHYVGRPLIGTSANLSGQPSALSVEDILPSLSTAVSLIMDGGPSPLGVSSTVVDLTVSPFQMLREGTITEAAITSILPR